MAKPQPNFPGTPYYGQPVARSSSVLSPTWVPLVLRITGSLGPGRPRYYRQPGSSPSSVLPATWGPAVLRIIANVGHSRLPHYRQRGPHSSSVLPATWVPLVIRITGNVGPARPPHYRQPGSWPSPVLSATVLPPCVVETQLCHRANLYSLQCTGRIHRNLRDAQAGQGAGSRRLFPSSWQCVHLAGRQTKSAGAFLSV